MNDYNNSAKKKPRGTGGSKQKNRVQKKRDQYGNTIQCTNTLDVSSRVTGMPSTNMTEQQTTRGDTCINTAFNSEADEDTVLHDTVIHDNTLNDDGELNATVINKKLSIKDKRECNYTKLKEIMGNALNKYIDMLKFDVFDETDKCKITNELNSLEKEFNENSEELYELALNEINILRKALDIDGEDKERINKEIEEYNALINSQCTSDVRQKKLTKIEFLKKNTLPAIRVNFISAILEVAVNLKLTSIESTTRKILVNIKKKTKKDKYKEKLLEPPKYEMKASKAVCTSRGGRSVEHAEEIEPKPIPKKFISPIKGWEYAREKVKNIDNVNVSPIKPSLINIEPISDYQDPYISGFTWVINMSEVNFYDNILLLLHDKLDKNFSLGNIILANIHEITKEYMLRNWKNAYALGKGGFGVVFKVLDKKINTELAVKYMTYNSNVTETKYYIMYLRERNYLMRAHSSPYIVRLLNSLDIPEFNGLFLIFEFCIGDLNHFFSALIAKTPTYAIRDLLIPSYVNYKQAYVTLRKNFEINLHEVVTIYIFEILVILNYLGDCNIVHCDIKPQNLMISKDLHLKLGDFGVVNNCHFVTENGQMNLYQPDDENFDIVESKRDNIGVKGTSVFFDMEMAMNRLKKVSRDLYDQLKLEDLVDNFDERNYENDFLSDLWAGGLVILQLMLLGDLITNYNISPELLQFFPNGAVSNPFIFITTITMIEKMYTRIFVDGLRISFEKQFGCDFIKFITSIFQPRSIRASDYIKEKNLLFYNKLKTYKLIDLDKIVQLDLFQSTKLSPHNSLLFKMPNKLRNYVEKPRTETFMGIEEFLNVIIQPNTSVRFGCTPGANLSVL